MDTFYYKTFSILALPLILIHGYSDDSSVWDTWNNWLEQDNITKVTSINFKDSCGSVAEHAQELKNIIKKNETVNIVAHSKGGLDAREYISQNPGRVANLIMIGTPNLGTPAAYMEVTECMFSDSAAEGRKDLEPLEHPNDSGIPDINITNYYTVAGNLSSPCYFIMAPLACSMFPNDGFVTVDSAKSHYQTLGTYPYNHTSLLTSKDIYQKVMSIITNE